MVGPEVITRAVLSYIEFAGSGRADEMAALYATDAVVEDPVGGEIRRGAAAIRAFCHAVMDGSDIDVELLSLNQAGAEAAFHFRVTTAEHHMDVIDVMTFDDDGKITSMKAYWGPSNIVERP